VNWLINHHITSSPIHQLEKINMKQEVLELWPELMWINDPDLREKTAKTWETALEKSVLSAADLQKIPFTLLAGPDLKVSFMAHKRCVVHVARDAGNKMNEFFKADLPVNMDVLIAGAILADVGKLLEYELDKDGKSFQGKYGKYLRHPFSGVSLAEQCGVPAEVCHIISAHAGEGDMIKRTVEAYIVHHADFMTFEPFRDRLK
jgi:putative nucleotidyltransferase with HDIG domain